MGLNKTYKFKFKSKLTSQPLVLACNLNHGPELSLFKFVWLHYVYFTFIWVQAALWKPDADADSQRC